MKKKAIKIAASTAVAASAFVAAAPAQQADAATNVNQLITDAQNAGTVLKWAISVEGSADYATRPYDQYNAAKKAIKAAEDAAAKLSASEKLSATAKLVEPKLQEKRAQAYIDAITSSEKIKELTANLDAAIKTDDIEKVETAYHKATAEYRKQAALLDRVYGQSTRDGIRDAVKPAIEKLVASVKNEVTVNMLAKSAAANVKAGKSELASKDIAEAQAILDANVLKWETSLQKSVDDVATSLPLAVQSVTRVNDTTVEVKLNKAVDAVYTSDFTFDNSLVVTSAVLASDKKTVTLTTTKQEAGKTYTVTYKGTNAAFTTPSAAAGNITADGSEVYSDLNKSEVVYATFKDDNGRIDQSPVTLTVPAGLKVVSVNGASTGAAGLTGASASFVPNASGQLTIIVQGNSPTSVIDQQLTYKQGDNEEVSAKLNFYEVLTSKDLNDTLVVSYADAAKDFFIVSEVADATKEYKIKLKSSDILQVASIVNANDFKAKLSKGDKVQGTYSKDSSSFLNLFFDKPAGFDFEINEPDTVRVDSSYATFTGKGEAGKVIAVYGLSGNLIKTATIASNGTWAVEVPVASAATGGNFYFAHHTTLSSSVPTSISLPTTLPAKTVVNGAFTAQSTFAPAGTADQSLNGDTLVLTVDDVAGDKFKVQSGATITLRDGDGTTVTFKNKVENTTFTVDNDATPAAKLTIKFGYTAASGGTVGGLQGGLSVIAIDGVTNDNGLKLKTSGLTNLSGY